MLPKFLLQPQQVAPIENADDCPKAAIRSFPEVGSRFVVGSMRRTVTQRCLVTQFRRLGVAGLCLSTGCALPHPKPQPPGPLPLAAAPQPTTVSTVHIGQSSESAQTTQSSDIVPVHYDAASPVLLLDETGTVLAAPTIEVVANSSGMTLEGFLSLAYANNPAIRELAATTQKAAGFRNQVGLKPNPTVGYQAMQLADEGTDQHTLFFEQEFVTGNKLQYNRAVLNETLRAQLAELEAQRQRVATDIRVKFFEVLAAQRSLELISEFSQVVEQGTEIAKLRLEAMEGSKIDLLQATIQQSEIALMKQQTQIRLEAAWKELVALAGVPDLPMAAAVGDLPATGQSLMWDALLAQIVSNSPEYQAAQIRIQRARLNLQRHNIQPQPNWVLQFAAGVDNGTDSGMMNLQLGAPLPIHNQNQGNIAAARAEYCRAVLEAERIERAIQMRLASVGGEYDQATAAAQLYSDTILPSALESLQLAETAYKAGETSFLQVLVARRTFFDSNLVYVNSQANLAQAQAKIDGFLLTGGLDEVRDESGDAALRDLTFTQQ